MRRRVDTNVGRVRSSLLFAPTRFWLPLLRTMIARGVALGKKARGKKGGWLKASPPLERTTRRLLAYYPLAPNPQPLFHLFTFAFIIPSLFKLLSRSAPMKRIAATLACLLLLTSSVFAPRHAAQEDVDRSLAEEIFKIRAIDHHAHPLRATREGEDDREFDALIPDTLEPSRPPVRLRPDNPEFVGAWRDFWGYRHDDMAEAHLREVVEARRRAAREQADSYPAW